jgi:hypothetical protein
MNNCAYQHVPFVFGKGVKPIFVERKGFIVFVGDQREEQHAEFIGMLDRRADLRNQIHVVCEDEPSPSTQCLVNF